ncbi:hypothetical protein [Angustibacter luteus]
MAETHDNEEQEGGYLWRISRRVTRRRHVRKVRRMTGGEHLSR